MLALLRETIRIPGFTIWFSGLFQHMWDNVTKRQSRSSGAGSDSARPTPGQTRRLAAISAPRVRPENLITTADTRIA